MLSTTGISLSFGGQTVLRGVSCTLSGGARAGLVGANGSGKTTFLRILAGEMPPDSGTVTCARGRHLAYLPQKLEFPGHTTLLDLCEEGYLHEHALAAERHQAAEVLEREPHDTAALNRLAEVDTLLEQRGYHERHTRISHILHGLGFAPGDEARLLREFSGGWRMRGALARTLLTRADILLLDEPTNYLDREARDWLASFLRGFPGSIVLVSHDRAFLDETITEVLELFHGTITRYRGTYTEYEKTRSAELSQQVAAWKEQQRDIARQEDFIRRFRAQANRARQVQSRIRQLEKVERIELPEHLRPITITLPPAPRSGDLVVECTELKRSYNGTAVLESLNLTIHRGTRLAVVGRNGAGKSTLLRILAGGDTPSAGELRYGSHVSPAYFAQESPDTLPSGETVISYMEHSAAPDALPRVRDILGAFLFSGDAVEKPLEVLSGGERSRLALAALLVRPVNFLILDEPTNHLDMTSQEVLSRALQHYGGTVVMVSHDRHFLREVATDVLALWPRGAKGADVPPHRWTLYPGEYTAFEGSAAGNAFFRGDDDASPGVRTPPREDPGAQQYRRQKAARQEYQRLKRQEEEVLAELETLEDAARAIEEEMAGEAAYRNPEVIADLQRRLRDNTARQDALHLTWETVAARLAHQEDQEN